MAAEDSTQKWDCIGFEDFEIAVFFPSFKARTNVRLAEECGLQRSGG
jgi:hypothetical protein